ncbi:MAG: ABC transporter permease [Actinomycetota bacterium]
MARTEDRFLRGVTGGVFLFLYAPILVLVVLAFNESGLPTTWSGFSLHWYREAFANTAITSSLRNTLVVAIASMVLSTVIGSMLAMGLERAARRSRALASVVYAPLVIPDIVLAAALLSFYNLVFSRGFGLQLGLWSVILAHTTFNIAFVAAIVRTRFRDMDWSTVEASLDLGASHLRTIRKVVLPTVLPGVVAAALVAFTLSLDEFVIAFFTAGTAITFPIQVYSMIRFGVTPEVNAISSVVIVASTLLLIASQRLRGGRVL